MAFDSIDNIVGDTNTKQPKTPKSAGRDRLNDHVEDDFQSHIVTRCMADVAPTEVSWLWHHRIPAGKLCLLVGDPGLGKSFLTIDVAARLSSGTPWPDRRNEPIEPASVVILSAEDDASDTIRPRLDAAGADPSKVFFVDGVKRSPAGDPQHFRFDRYMAELESCIVDTSARLCIVDPVTAYLGKADSNSNGDIRGMLGPLSELAARRDCAILAVSHLNKGGGGSAIYRSMGSLAFPAAARIAWLVAKDSDDPTRRLVLPIKANIVQEPTGIAFRIVDGCLHWDDAPVAVDADAALCVDPSQQAERQEAADWLTERLATGPMLVNEIRKVAEADCISWRTLERAKKSLGVKSDRDGFGPKGKFTWELPSNDAS